MQSYTSFEPLRETFAKSNHNAIFKVRHTKDKLYYITNLSCYSTKPLFVLILTSLKNNKKTNLIHVFIQVK